MRSYKRAAVLVCSTALLTVTAAACGSDDDTNDSIVPETVVPGGSIDVPTTVIDDTATTMMDDTATTMAG